jgi:hypothetical protein
VAKLSSSVRSVQRVHGTNAEFFGDRIHTLDSKIGECTEEPIKDDCISVWNAINFLHAGLDSIGKSLRSLEDTLKSTDSSLQEKIKNSDASVQATFTQVSQSFQDLVNFTKAGMSKLC